jgi:hypothetical protein
MKQDLSLLAPGSGPEVGLVSPVYQEMGVCVCECTCARVHVCVQEKVYVSVHVCEYMQVSVCFV